MIVKVLKSGHKVEVVDGEEMEAIRKEFPGYTTNLIRLTPGRWLFLDRFTNFANQLYDFKWRSSDVVVMTYPKCGTTWTQEIVWTMRNNPDLDNPEGATTLLDRVPFIDCDMFIPEDTPADSPFLSMSPAFRKFCPDADPKDGIYLQLSEALPDPRTIKTHLSLSLFHPSLLDTVKVVYVMRNPKAVAVSYHHHSRLFSEIGFHGPLDKFVKYFTEGNLVYDPYWVHVKEAWELREHPNLHLIFYEDLKADIMSELRRLDTFLGTHLSDTQLAKVAEHTSFNQMKARSIDYDSFASPEVLQSEGGFFRKGESNDWQSKFTPELEAHMDAWVKEKFDFGIQFK